MKKTLEFATRVIHGGQEPDPRTGAVVRFGPDSLVVEQDGKRVKSLRAS